MGQGERPGQQQDLSNLHVHQLIQQAYHGHRTCLLCGQRATRVLFRALRPHGQPEDRELLVRHTDTLRDLGVPVGLPILCHSTTRLQF